ncbi:MAG: MFS transporter [Steroidobacteraceae bacterium]
MMLFNTNSEWHQGWRVVVGAAFGMGTSYGLLMMTSGLFLKPMQEDFGWSRAALSFLPIISVISALMLPLTGYLLDRFGARVIGIIGLLALIAGYVLMAVVPPHIVIFYLVVGFIGLTASATGGISWTRGVATWFVHSRGAAFGLSMCGTSIISAGVMPFLNSVIATHGWRAGFVTLAAITLILGVPPVLLFFRERTKPGHRDHATGPAHAQPGLRLALASRRFWLLFGCFALVSIPLGGFMVHLVPILSDKGIDSGTAAMVGSVFALSIAVGRVAAGFLLDRVSPQAVAATCFTLPVIGVLLLNNLQPGVEQAGLIAAISGALIGLAQGAEGDFIAFFTARYFPLHMYSRVFGLIAMGTYAMISLGGLMFASLYDLFGRHQIAMFIAIGCYSSAALLILFVEKIEPSSQPSHRLESIEDGVS